MTAEDPGALLGLALEIAGEASAVLRAAAGRADLHIDRKSSVTDLVTEIDHAVEALVTDRIGQARPGDAILGEEGADRPGTTGIRWVVDPIDGTTNFVYGMPGYAVSIAAERSCVPLIGVVAVPALGETFTAVAGGGARCNGESIRASSKAELATALIGTGFSYDAGRRASQGTVVAALLPRIRDVRRMGAASVDLCAVACGRLDGYYESGLAPWDWAAGALIAAEAGAIVTGLHGGPPSRTSLVAAGSDLHELLCSTLVDLGA